jgi:glc operon protein GlcG
MRNVSRCLSILTLWMVAGLAGAQQAPSTAQEVLPGQMSPSPPYGPPLTLAQAEKVLAAAKSEAHRLKASAVVIAVVGPYGELVAFAKMDDATIHSIAYAQQKAQSAARLRRVTNTPPPDMAAALTSMPDFTAMPGGVPIVEAGKTIGGVGISGAENGGDLIIAKAASKALQ